MRIKYTLEQAARLAELHGLAANNRVLGFATWDYSGGQIMETLYALAASGKTYSSTHLKSDDFNPIGRIWELVEGVPPEAEFIGGYPRPSNII